MSTVPVFDADQNHAVIYGSGGDIDPTSLPRYQQNGHYFRSDHSYHSPDGIARRKDTAVPTLSAINTLPAVDEAEAADLLLDPRAEALLELPRDELARLVAAANGPMIVGEGSAQSMVAFLIKNTAASDEL